MTTFLFLAAPSSIKLQQTFVYKYQSENQIKNQDAQHDIQIKASVEIGTISPCLLSLKLLDVELQGVSVANRYVFKEALEKHAVLFQMEEGIIGEIRHDPSELPWAMNIKRAIISMIQIPRTSIDSNSIVSETDIFGTCETKYSPMDIRRDGGIVKKSKNLATCFGRFGSSLPIIYTPYESKTSPFQTIPMTNGTIDCEQRVDGNRWITKSTCREREFLEIGARGSAETTEIKSNVILTLMQTLPGIKPVPDTVNMMSSLKFDHSVTRIQKTDIKDAMSILRDLCRSTAEDIRPEASWTFSRMVAALRGLPYEHLKQIYAKIVNGELCFDRKLEALYLDALPMIGTEASLKQTVELMNKAEHASRSTAWIAGLSAISYPTEGMISVLIPMVKKANAPRSLILAVTSMAHVFCRGEERNCDEVPAIRELQGALTKILGYKCRATDIASRNKIVTALKGFGNLGYHGGAVNSILECALTGINALPIRLAAIESFRRSCIPEVHTKLMELTKVTSEDVEIRIASYLGVMRCPTFDDIVEISKMIENEKTQQVSSFIISHLSNLQETEAPSKLGLRSLLSAFMIKNKFDSDFRKSSQNIEWSEYSEKFNLGATADANVIYHPKSFIPRSLMMNLTVDLFSHSINLFEVGGRAEGYDHMLESLLAPKRQIGNEHKTDSFWSRFGEKLSRSRRASPKNTKVNFMKPNQPSGSIYFKMFGNELSWLELPTMEDISDFANGIRTDNWMTRLMNEGKMDIARSAMLIDTTVTVPTVTGLPFRFDIEATVTGGLKTDGKLNLEGAPKDMLIEGFIKPSASVDLNMVMSIDMGVGKRGIRVASTIHTSTALDGKVEIKPTGEINLKYNIRQEKQEILNLKSSIFSVEAEIEKPILPPATKDLNMCTSTLSKALGLSLCIKGRVPKPFVDPRGINLPFDLGLTLQKNDLAMEGYEFKLKFPVAGSDRSNQFYQLIMDTPGSSINRRHLIELQLNMPPIDEASMHFLYSCPMKKIEISASARMHTGLMLISTEAKIDDARRYFIKLESPYQAESDIIKFQPTLEMGCPNTEPFIMKGKIEKNHTDGLMIDMGANMPAYKPVSIKVSAVYNKLDHMQVEMEASLISLDIELVVRATRQERSAVTALNADYQWAGQRKHTIKYNHKLQDLGTEHICKTAVNADLQMSQYPEYNWQFMSDTQLKAGEHREHDIKFWWGENLPEEQRHIHVLAISKQIGEFGRGMKGTIEGRLKMLAPIWNIDVDGTFNNILDMEGQPKALINGEIKGDGAKVIEWEAKFDQESANPMRVSVSAKLEGPAIRLIYVDRIRQRTENEYDGNTIIEWGKQGKKISVDYQVMLKIDPDSTMYDIDYRVSYPNMKVPARHKNKLRFTRDAIEASTETEVNGNKYVTIATKWNRNKLAEITIDTPVFQTMMSRSAKAEGVNYMGEVRPRIITDRAYVASLQMKGSPQRSMAIQGEYQWDADRDASQRVRISSNLIKTALEGHPVYQINGVFEHCTHLKIDFNGNFAEDIMKGPHSMDLSVGGHHAPTRTMTMAYTRGESDINALLAYIKGGEDQLKIRFTMKEDHSGQDIDLNIASLLFPEIDGKRLNIQRSFERDISYKITYVHAPGEVYRMEFLDASGNGRINTNIKLQTPFPRYSSQQFRITGSYWPSTVILDMQATSSSNKIYNFKLKWEKKGRESAILEMDMMTPHESVRNGKLLMRWSSNDQTTEGQLKSVYNDHTMLDLNGNIRIVSSNQFDGRLSLKSAAVHDLDVHIQGQPASPHSSTYKLSLFEAGSNILSLVLTLGMEEHHTTGNLQVSGETIATRFIEVERKISENDHRIYSLRTGPQSPLHVVLETQLTGGVRITSMRYQSPNNPGKWALVSLENNEDWNSLNKKLTIIIEPKADIKMSIEYLFQKSDSLLKSKILGHFRENRLGYEFKSRTEGDSSSSTLMKMHYFKREMDIHYDEIRTPDSMETTLKILLNSVMMPDRMFVMTYKGNRIPNGWQGITTMSHPTFLNDISLKAQFQTDISEKIPLKIMAEILPGDAANKIYFNLIHKLDDQIATNRSIHIHMHHEDRSIFDTSLTVYRTATMERPIFGGYYWSWTTQRQGHKAGHATLFLGKNGRANFDYDSFMGKISASGENQKAPNGDDMIDVILHGKNQEFKGRLIYNLKKYHLEGLTFDKDGNIARSFEISASNSSKKDALKLEMSHYEGNNRLTDFSYAMERRGNKAFRSKLFFPPKHVQTMKMALSEVGDNLSEIDISAITRDIEDICEKADSYVDKNFMQPLSNHLLDEFGEIMGEAVIEISEILEEAQIADPIAEIQRWLDNVKQTVSLQIKRMIRAIVDPIMSMTSSVGHRRRRRDISSSWDDLNRYMSIKMDEFYNSPMIRRMSTWMNDVMDYTSDKIRETMYRVSAKIGEGIDAIKENPDYKALESITSELYQPGRYEGQREFWQKLMANLENEYSARKTTVIREADTKNGKYIVDINLPSDIDSIKQQLNEWFIEWKMPDQETEHEPSFADYISSLARRKWLPPFDGQAMIISQQHFVTFDGSMYSAIGDCTYLLARDFVDGNFTVLLKYHSDNPLPDGRIPKSIIVQLGDSYIEVFPDKGSMFLNGQAVELPLILEDGNVIVKRVDDVVIIEDEKILKVACHLYYDVCTVKINGWYFGNTAGLLGTYNNEPSDDFMRPRGQIVNNVGQFMKKWETTRGCKAPVNVLRNTSPEGSEGYQLCERYFKNDDSPLYEGFWQESPEPYFDLCLRHMAALPANEEPMKAVCNISLAYLLQLEKYSIMASLPTECLTCQIAANQKLGFGETTRIDNVPSSMDIVLVVEEDACHADIVRELDSTIRLVDKELIAAGFSNNRFSLIGFGHGSGRNSRPHIRTARGNVFFESHNLPLATQKMRIEPVAMPARETHKDIFDAIRFASVMPFRPGVSKTIIVMACADCDEERSELSYSDIQNQLLEHGITLHLVSDKPIEVRKSIIKGKGIYGLDADSVYGSKDVSQRLLLGQPDLRPQVAVAKDVCIALAQEVHGSFFSTTALRSDGKNWKTVFAKRIVKSLQPRGGDRDFCERCDCTHAPDFTPIAICRPCQALSPRVPLAVS
ncbi:unnamed protein product [Ixodes hexagonus]